MKKLSFILALSLVLSNITAVFASDELEAVITDVKSRIEIAEYENFDSSYYGDDVSGRVYNLSWGNNSEGDFEYVEVSYSNGFILNYSHSKNTDRDRQNKFPKLSVDEALAIAKDFSDKVNPDFADRIILENNSNAVIGGTSYYFNLKRMEQGFPVDGDTGVIRVDNETGRVTYYNMIFEIDAEFPVIGEPIHRDDALSEYKAELAPKLQYSNYYNYKTKVNKIFLEYVSNEGNKRIDALTGEVIELPSNYELYNYGALKETAADQSSGSSGGGLSRAELDEIEKISALLTQDDAEKIARECKAIGLTDTDVLQSAALNRYFADNERLFYSLSFSSDAKWKTVNVDATDGSIIAFSKKSVYQEDYVHNTENELKIAEDLFKTLAPEKFAEYKLTSNENGNIEYVRLVNGVEVSFDRVNFRIDDSGEIASFNLSYTKNAEFPTPETVLTSDKVCDLLAEEYAFSPMFAVDRKTNETVLFYTFENNFRVDPYTAKPIDYKGDIITEGVAEKIAYIDIEGHYAEDKIIKLAQYGIGFKGGKLDPDATITQKELVELLGALNNTTDYEYLLERFISNKVIDKVSYSENETLTKSEAAVIFIRMIGAEEYAKFDSIYTSPFNDVTENKGYISLLKALKVVYGTPDGNFYPDKSLSRVEALVMVYNYLSR